MTSSSDAGRAVAARNSAMDSGLSVVKNAGTASSVGSSSGSNGGRACAVISILRSAVKRSIEVFDAAVDLDGDNATASAKAISKLQGSDEIGAGRWSREDAICL